MIKFIFGLLMLMLSCLALAQGDVIILPVGDDWSSLLTAIGGLKGASALTIVFVVVKVLALLFRTPLGKFAGLWQLIIINGLMAVLGVLGAKLAGAEWLPSIVSGTNLALVSLFGNQIFKQVFKKGKDEAIIVANS